MNGANRYPSKHKTKTQQTPDKLNLDKETHYTSMAGLICLTFDLVYGYFIQIKIWPRTFLGYLSKVSSNKF